jgi:hypothetical protein
VLVNGLLQFGWWVVSWQCSVDVGAKFGGCGQAECIVAKKDLRRRLYFGCLEFCTVQYTLWGYLVKKHLWHSWQSKW